MNGARFYYYIDYGSGWTEIHPYDNQLKLGIRREINPLIQRKYVSGQFTLIDDEYDDAFDFFITSVNYDAPMQIYEHGTSGSGNLVWEGWTNISGEDNAGEKKLSLNEFKTNDNYTTFLDYIKKEISGSGLYLGTTISRFTIEGSATNANKLTAFTWSSPNFSQAGNQLDIGLVGRPCTCSINNKFIIFDEHTKTLRSFDFDGTDFTTSSNGTLLDIGAILISNYGHCAITGIDPDEVLLLLQVSPPVLRHYQATSGTWTLLNEYDFQKSEYPSLSKFNSTYYAFVDNTTKQLQTLDSTLNYAKLGTAFDLGDVERPKVSFIDTNVVAVIDENTLQLQAFTFDGGVTNTWSKTGTSIALPQMIDPSITWVATNTINIHDTFSGKLYYYSFSGTAWTLTGSGSSYAGGVSSSICGTGTYTFGLISDALVVNSDVSASIESVLLTIFDIYSLSGYDFDEATCGATFDIENCFFGNMETLGDVGNPGYADVDNTYNYTIEETLKFAEVFQNYWHLVEDTGTSYVEFLPPNLFSSIGTDIDITLYAPDYNQRRFLEDYKIRREKLRFNNAYGIDFATDFIEYTAKNTDIELITDYPLTNDFDFIVDSFTKRNYKALQKSGLFVMIIDTDSYAVFIPSGTSPLSNSIRNEACSTTRIYEDYMKDYRYAFIGSFELNGNTVNVQDTCRNIINFPTIRLSNGLDNFPSSIGSLTGGTYTQYIINLEVDLSTYEFTVDSILLDL